MLVFVERYRCGLTISAQSPILNAVSVAKNLMQQPWTHYLQASLDRHPNVGRLVELCEENFLYLQKLLPELREMRGCYCSRGSEHADLFLEVVEHARYTSIVHLTYYFEQDHGREPEPDVLLKVYHDAEQVEVIDLKQSSLPVHSLYEAPGLLNKWQVNLFVSKWLAFCVYQGHHFSPQKSRELAEAL